MSECFFKHHVITQVVGQIQAAHLQLSYTCNFSINLDKNIQQRL